MFSGGMEMEHWIENGQGNTEQYELTTSRILVIGLHYAVNGA